MLHRNGWMAVVVLCGLVARTGGGQPTPGIDRRTYEADLTAALGIFTAAAENTTRVVDDLGNPLPTPIRQMPRVQNVQDLFQLILETEGAAPRAVRTHLFRDPLKLVPYSDTDDTHDAAGNPVPRGDSAIAAQFGPGEIGFALRHQRPSFRAYKPSDTVSKDEIRLQDTHVSVVIGVMRSGLPGAITASVPQTQRDGRFGAVDQPMIFVRPRFPTFIDPAARRLFIDNMRTMVLGFNAVSLFRPRPGSGDPLGPRTPEQIREYVAMMLRALCGDNDALTWFESDDHKIYSAEFCFIALTAGLLVPLNESHALPLLRESGLSEVRADQVWRKLQQEIALHNRGQQSAFTLMNENKLVRLVQLADDQALASLKPMTQYGDARAQAITRDQPAFGPMSLSDIMEAFLSVHAPRQRLGEAIAPRQARLLREVKPGLLEMATVPRDSDAYSQLDRLLDRVIDTMEKPYENYEQFVRALEPDIARLRGWTGPRPGDGDGAVFVPPMLFHLVARGDRAGGLISLDYVGHGLHYALAKPAVPGNSRP